MTTKKSSCCHQLPYFGVRGWTFETDPKSFDQNRKIKTDFVTSAIMTWGIESFKPSFMRISNPYQSPRDSSFPSPVPIFVQLGGGEVLYAVGVKTRGEYEKGARKQGGII